METSTTIVSHTSMPFFATCKGEKPKSTNINAAERTIPTRFVINSKNAVENICQSAHPNPIPATARGGTKATAMATPAREPSIFSLLFA